MNKLLRLGGVLSLLLLCGQTMAGGDPREAYLNPAPGLDAPALDTFYRGRTEFLQSWAVAPEGGNVSGLGPLFNRIACISCHQHLGRGRSPDGPDERMLSMLVRLSITGRDPHGGPQGHPAYGTQLNEEGIPGVPGEGRAAMHWQEKTVHLADGTAVALRQPRLEFADLAYGPADGLLASPRVGQPVYGLGLLEAVPVRTLQRIATDQKKQGIRGRLNMVWDVALQRQVPGRFGWKANSPNLRQQMAEAFLGDMGVTTTLFPDAQCAPQQHACRGALKAKSQPELSGERLDDLDFFAVHLVPPAQRDADNPAVRRGQRAFAAMGCAACHTPRLETAAHPRYPATLPAQAITPYSDLLLHDMGPGLADGRPDFHASGRQWRTPPLWGIGLVPAVNGHSQYLHDGRARNLEEAVLWHGGEASGARSRYMKSPRELRLDLLAFLRSL